MPVWTSAPNMCSSLRNRVNRLLRRAPKGTSFCSLPSEIRQTIYKSIFRGMRVKPVKLGDVILPCPPMLLVSKNLQGEIKEAMVENATVVVYHECSLHHLNRMPDVLEHLRHIEIKASFLQISPPTGSSSIGINGEAQRALTWQDCWLSCLPKLKTVVVVASPPPRPVESSPPVVASINCDEGVVQPPLYVLTKLVQRAEVVSDAARDGSSTTVAKKYFEGELWKELAERAGRKIEWELSVPFYVETIWTVIKGFWGWKGPRWRWNKRWVFGRMDFDEKVLRFEIEGWKWKDEFSQLLG